MFTKDTIDRVTTVLGLVIIATTTLSENDFIDKKLGRTIGGLATGMVSVLVCADKTQLLGNIQASKQSLRTEVTFQQSNTNEAVNEPVSVSTVASTVASSIPSTSEAVGS